MDDTLTKIVTNNGYTFIFLIGLTFVLHIIFIFLFKIKKESWIYLEYIALFFISLGLITITGSIRTTIAKNYFKSSEKRVEAAFDQIKYYLYDGSPPYICRTFIRTEFSPSNFKEIQIEYDKACNWYMQVAKNLPGSIKPNYPELKFFNLPKIQFTDVIIVESINWIHTLFDNYENQRKEMMEIKKKIPKSMLETSMNFLSPIFICITLAIAITKKTWELKEQNKNVKEES